ncbi:MAG: 50S ribosomal protein L33 [Pseudomonadota bacterium]
MSDIIHLECTVCKHRNYSSTRNKKKNQTKVRLKKYCKFCRKHIEHKETK